MPLDFDPDGVRHPRKEIEVGIDDEHLQDDYRGRIQRVVGMVTLHRAGKSWTPSLGAALKEGDELGTGDEGRVDYLTESGMACSLGPNEKCRMRVRPPLPFDSFEQRLDP